MRPPASPAASASPTAVALPASIELLATFDQATSELEVPAGLDIGPDGNIYVANAGNDEVLVLDPGDGGILRRWGSHGTGQDEFGDPIRGSRSTARASSMSPTTSTTASRNSPQTGHSSSNGAASASGDGQFAAALDIAVGPNGDVYVRDEVRDDLQQFTSDGKFVRVVAKHGTGPGDLNGAGKVGVAPDGTVIATSFDGNRILAFDANGNLLWSLGQRGRAPGDLIEPSDTATDAAGNVWVLEYRNRIQVFNAAHEPIAIWPVPVPGDEIVFIAIDADGVAYVSDYYFHHIYKLRLVD